MYGWTIHKIEYIPLIRLDYQNKGDYIFNTLKRLPKTEIMKFDGDPLKYWQFIRTFDSIVGNTQVDPTSKLNVLLQYCTGKALQVIECCVIMDPTVLSGILELGSC